MKHLFFFNIFKIKIMATETETEAGLVARVIAQYSPLQHNFLSFLNKNNTLVKVPYANEFKQISVPAFLIQHKNRTRYEETMNPLYFYCKKPDSKSSIMQLPAHISSIDQLVFMLDTLYLKDNEFVLVDPIHFKEDAKSTTQKANSKKRKRKASSSSQETTDPKKTRNSMTFSDRIIAFETKKPEHFIALNFKAFQSYKKGIYERQISVSSNMTLYEAIKIFYEEDMSRYFLSSDYAFKQRSTPLGPIYSVLKLSNKTVGQLVEEQLILPNDFVLPALEFKFFSPLSSSQPSDDSMKRVYDQVIVAPMRTFKEVIDHLSRHYSVLWEGVQNMKKLYIVTEKVEITCPYVNLNHSMTDVISGNWISCSPLFLSPQAKTLCYFENTHFIC